MSVLVTRVDVELRGGQLWSCWELRSGAQALCAELTDGPAARLALELREAGLPADVEPPPAVLAAATARQA